MTYGFPVQRSYDPIVHRVEQAMTYGAFAASPGTFLVNVIPQLRHIPEWMPGANFKKFGRELGKALVELRDGPFRSSLESIVCFSDFRKGSVVIMISFIECWNCP